MPMPWRKRCRRPASTDRYVATLRRCLYTQSHHTGGYLQQVPIGATFDPDGHSRTIISSPARVTGRSVATRLLFEGMTTRRGGLWRGSRRTGAAVVRARGGRRGMARLPVRPGLEAPRAPGELAGPRHHRPRPHPRLVGAPALQHRHRLRPVRPCRHRPGRRPRRTRTDADDAMDPTDATPGRDSTAPLPARTPSSGCAGRTVSATRRAPTPSTRRRGKPPLLHRPRDAGAELGRAAAGRSSTSARTAATWSGTAA